MDAQGKADRSAETVQPESFDERYQRHRRKMADPDREARRAAWREENSEAIESYNRWYEKNGHPLARFMVMPGDAVIGAVDAPITDF